MTDESAEIRITSEWTSDGVRHKTLSAYYSHIQTLGNFLSTTTGTDIRTNDDVQIFRDILSHTICGINDSDRTAFRLELGSGVHGSQQEAIDRILREVGKQATKEGLGRNVLLAGNRFPVAELPINVNRPHAENRHVNSPSSVLRSLPWRILRHRLGDDAFRKLIVHTSLFLPVGNNCFMQLSGAPIYDLYEHLRFSSVKTITSARKGKRKRTGKNKCERCKRVKLAVEVPETANGVGLKQRKHNVLSPAETIIPRQRMFYGRPARLSNGKLSPGLPSHHIFNRLCATESRRFEDYHCLLLLRDIFPRLFEKSVEDDDRLRVMKGSQKRVEALKGLAREILARHVGLDYRKLFREYARDRHSDSLLPHVHSATTPTRGSQLVTQASLTSPSLASIDNRTSIHAVSSSSNEPPQLQPVSHKQVARYLAAVLRGHMSTITVGSQHNFDTILSYATRFIVMKQYEPVNVHTLMQGFRVTDLTWLDSNQGQSQRIPQAETSKRRLLAEDFIKWLFDGLIIPLLKNSFYITETAATRYETVYFAHDDWARATRPHFVQLQRTLLTELDRNQAFFAQQGPLGVSAVRLIPKPNGFRPIVNLGRKIKQKNTLGIPTSGLYRGSVTANQILRGVHQILTYEKTRHRSELGGSLFGTNEIFAPLQSLKKELLTTYGSIPRLFFVKMDIKAAFDTVKQDRMLQIVSDLLDKNHDYCLMLYCLLLPPASKVSQGSARRLFKSRAIINDHLSASFGDHAKEIAEPLRNAVIVDLVRRRHVTRESCMELLRIHIQDNVWQVGKKYFRQKTGIPQGSKISSLLCSFFYACMENEHLVFTRRPGSRLLRYIDDFLLVTDDYPTARRFVDTMSRGLPAYGAEVSKGKTLLSFEHATGSQMAPVCGVAEDGEIYFPYCGFLINMRTLEIMPDYPRMMTGSLKQSFALRNTRHRGSSFVGWFSRQLENRNHVAYLDTVHNSINTVYFNIFINFALTTMKVPHYFANEVNIRQQSKLIYEALRAAAEYTYAAGRARVRHASRADNNKGREHYAVRKRDFLFIAMTSMVKVLSKKAGMFKLVVDSLNRDLNGRACRDLTDRHAAVVEKGWAAVKSAKY